LGPFNFPAHLPNGHIIPALLAGNTVVFKPSEQTPLVAKIIMVCWQESGIPPGVINMVQGGSATGKLLTSHPTIKGILFTGSWSTGSILSEIFAKTPNKILALEMGGNNPIVIGDVKNIPAAAFIATQAAFLTSGQRCTCARRLIIHEGALGDKIIKSLIKTVEALHVGPYTDKPEPFMGPLISAKAAEAVYDAYTKLVESGGVALVAMKKLPQGKAFLSPGVVDVTHVTDRSDEEIFGPLLQLIRVKTFEDAIEEANNTQYGLCAGLLSDDRKQFDQFYKEIHAGLINWNNPLTGASSAAPFGGVGKSGNFRPSAYYAADYCAYPVVSMESNELSLPKHQYPGISVTEDCCG
jgi:succinylglutamic semialdehyde dehydrogenase